VHPSLSWINPFQIGSFSALISGVLIAVFIYWGWDSAVTVNEESRDATEGPTTCSACSAPRCSARRWTRS
jgi:hypothetical protein